MLLETGQEITVNSMRFDGTVRRSWTANVVECNDLLIQIVGKFDSDVTHSDLGLIRRGTISHEYFWLDRWYNVFRFDEPSGELRNFYFNICVPPNLNGTAIEYVDLDIDIVFWPDGRIDLLDIDEFEANILRFGYPRDSVNKALKTTQSILRSLNRRELDLLLL